MAGSSDRTAALEKRHFRNIRAIYTASYSDATQSSITRLLSPTWDVILNMKNLTNAHHYIAASTAGAYAGDSLGAYVTVRSEQ
jgi:hypothetical protein